MTQADETWARAEWTRHWDRLCLTALTLGTAALAVVVVFVFEAVSVTAGGSDVPQSGVIEVTAVSTIVAASFYFILAAFTALVVFFVSGETAIQLLVKRWCTASIYFWLMAEIAVIVFILILNLGIIAASDYGENGPGADGTPSDAPKGVVFPARDVSIQSVHEHRT